MSHYPASSASANLRHDKPDFEPPVSCLLAVQNLSVCRGDRELISDLSFQVSAGEGVHLMGVNGAGKTSLLRVLCGIGLASQGQVTLHARSLYLGHALGLKPELTVFENLEFYARLVRVLAIEDAINDALKRVGLLRYADTLAGNLSAGQKRRVGLARLLVEPAQLWLLDEPFAALDVDTSAWLCHELDAFMTRGGAVIVTSHLPVQTHMPLRELKVGRV